MSELGIGNGGGGFMCLWLGLLSGLYRLLGAILRSKTKVMAQFCSRGVVVPRGGYGEGVCNKWDICQLLLLPSLLLLLLLSMLLAAIKTRKNVYFGKGAILFFSFFLAPLYPASLCPATSCCCSLRFCLFAFWLGPAPAPAVQVVLCVNRHKYMCT